MHKIKNGILTHNDKKIYALGQSYYPSFHHAKYPVPPEGDRIGEMKKDIKMMHEMGFNHIRFAAIGITKLDENGKLVIDTPFVDAMIEEADKNDMSVSIRLQGYALNLHDYKNVLMIDNNGNEQNVNIWWDFIQTTFYHDGLREDNALATRGLAEHYLKYKNLVAFQIYNEPHYPTGEFYDYHPLTIKNYQKWLVENGVLTEREAARYNPPRNRTEQTPRMWALWRIFSRDSLTDFLNRSSDASKEASPDIPTYTCLTACVGGLGNSYRGVSYFDNARKMDIMGYTCYIDAEGINYYTMGIVLDVAASAAFAENKETWCIELDSRTSIPQRIFNKNTYNVIGSGAKGIVYYQWRGDYPSEATPIPNGCGLLNYDGTKVKNFDNAANMIEMINNISDYLVNAKKVNYNIGLLYSDYANFYCDAQENRDGIKFGDSSADIKNSVISKFNKIYSELRCNGYGVTIADAMMVEENKMNIKYLFVPSSSYLSPEEQEIVDKFISNGGVAFELDSPLGLMSGFGYKPYKKEREFYHPMMPIEDICDIINVKPLAKADSDFAALQMLEGDDYKVIVVTNISCVHEKIDTIITCEYDLSEAILYTNTSAPVKLEIDGRKIIADNIADGGIIITK